MAPPRRPRNSSLQRANPLRDLVSRKQRTSGIVREKQRVQQLKNDLPSIIEDRVGDQIQKLETKLLTDFKEMGEKAIEHSTAVLGEQLNERIDTLEKVSKMQTKTLATLRNSSQIADEKVSAVVLQIERSLAGAVPGGFALAPPTVRPAAAALKPPVPGPQSLNGAPPATHPQFQLPPVGIVVAEPVDVSELVGRFGFCPNCTSTNVRRANRTGLFEEFLRLFFIAPFRCRACRHKFYRF